MFKFLKEKLKAAVSSFTKDVEEQAEVVQEDVLLPAEKQPSQPKPKKEKTATVKETKETKGNDAEKKNVEKVKETKAEQSNSKENVAGKKVPVKESQKAIRDETKEIGENKKAEKSNVTEEKESAVQELSRKEKQEEKQITSEPVQQEKPIEQQVDQKEIDATHANESPLVLETIEEPQEEPQEKKGFFKKLFGKKEKSEELVDKQDVAQKKPLLRETDTELVKTAKQEPVSKKAPVAEQEPEEKKKGFFSSVTERLTRYVISEEKFNELFWEIEIALLENNVAVEVIEKVKDDLWRGLQQEKLSKKDIEEKILATLKSTFDELLSIEQFDLLEQIEQKKPYIICMIGVNGSGKTTTLAKLVYYLQQHNKTVVVAAADTFRAAAIDQLKEHTEILGVKLIAHDYQSDPAAVAYDAVAHAKAKDIDVVLIDSAGRLHSNDNLMNELKKIIRVSSPDLKLFVGESITGNDCVEQTKVFNDAVGIDGIVLSKADVDEKGGAAISVSYITRKPILFLGTGQTYDDLEPFSKEKILNAIGL
ncbi:MAG: signal recognition particle-docking protein FtsY [Candidatus Woesearchaeota archaeon]|nr:MAG: signal recognition particle-docking protein FtsY [Candidatus Woesearchaeota archaeon]